MADEPKRILVDVNVFIDILEKRANWQNSLAVVSAVDGGIFDGYVSAVTKLILYKSRIREKATSLGCNIIALEVMPDHVHLFLQADPTFSPNKIVGMIKGYSSRILRREFPELRSRLPTLWTRSYFVSTHGHVSSDTIKKYVEEQKGV